MRVSVRKCFFAWNYEKEEAWLNQMAAQGLALTSVNLGRYEFEECARGAYTVRLELLEYLPGHPVSRNYIRFLEETGAEHIGSILRWVYFRKKTADGPFDLFSDLDSRIKHAGRAMALLGICGLGNLAVSLGNLTIFLAQRMTVNLVGSGISFAMSLLLLTGYLRISMQRHRFQKERLLRE